MIYGNTMKTVKHVAKVGLFLWIFIAAVFAITAYSYGKLNSVPDIIFILWYPLIIASILPGAVWITTLLNVVIENNNIYLLAFYKMKYNQQKIENIKSIKAGRGLFSIHFEDGSSIRTLGMYIPEIYRLVKDIKALKSSPLKVSSDWLSIK